MVTYGHRELFPRITERKSAYRNEHMGRCIRFNKAASCLVGVLCSCQHQKLNLRNKTTVISGKAQKALGPICFSYLMSALLITAMSPMSIIPSPHLHILV